jgi:hypothetical protein
LEDAVMKTVLSSIALAAVLCAASPAIAEGFTDTFGIKLKEPKGFLGSKYAKVENLQVSTAQYLPGVQAVFPNQPKAHEIRISNVVSMTTGPITYLAGYKEMTFSCRLHLKPRYYTECDDPVKSTAVASISNK